MHDLFARQFSHFVFSGIWMEAVIELHINYQCYILRYKLLTCWLLDEVLECDNLNWKQVLF